MSVYLHHNASSPMHVNVAGIVGHGMAAELARLEIEQRRHHLQQLRGVFENSPRDADKLASGLPQLVDRLPVAVRRAAV